MENNLMIFDNEEFGQVRCIKIDDKPYAVGVDVARALGYAKPNEAITAHCDDPIIYGVTDRLGRKQNTKIIPESDIYNLIFEAAKQSKNPEIKIKAVKFKKWVFEEVLPTIRKTGGYVDNDEVFIDTYLPFVDDTTKAFFKSNLIALRNQNRVIEEQRKEIGHKDGVIKGLVKDITIAEKRQILNRVVRRCSNYQDRWKELYRQFEMKYHVNIGTRFKTYNSEHKPKLKNKLDYVDKVLNKIPELYSIACKLYENDVNELIKEMYSLQENKNFA